MSITHAKLEYSCNDDNNIHCTVRLKVIHLTVSTIYENVKLRHKKISGML